MEIAKQTNAGSLYLDGMGLEDAMRICRRDFLLTVLDYSNGSPSLAARKLNIHRNTLDRQLAEVGLKEVLAGRRAARSRSRWKSEQLRRDARNVAKREARAAADAAKSADAPVLQVPKARLVQVAGRWVPDNRRSARMEASA